MSRALTVLVERFPIAGRFTIARGAKTEAVVVTVTLKDGDFIGRGECVPYTRYNETIASVSALIESHRSIIESGITRSQLRPQLRSQLQSVMPAGAARNAVDCALWDLEAKKSGIPAMRSAGVEPLKPVITAYTISLDTPEAMAEATRKASHRPLLKIKLGGSDGDLARIRAVREAAPQAQLIADANEGWTEANLVPHLRACREANYSLVEQPLPSTNDEPLRRVERLVALCADESVHDRKSLERLVGLYDVVNIKLDKTGGLTEALALVDEAREKGFEIMVGCMVGTSLAMAPALLLAPKARFTDLDGPLLLARDRENGLQFEGSLVSPPTPSLWG